MNILKLSYINIHTLDKIYFTEMKSYKIHVSSYINISIYEKLQLFMDMIKNYSKCFKISMKTTN